MAHLRKRNPKTQARVRSRVCPGSRRPSLARRRSLEAFFVPHRAHWHEAGFQSAPERPHQLAGQRHDGDLADPPLDVADALDEPAAQLATRLIPQPPPGQLDCGFRARWLPALLMPCCCRLSPLSYGVSVQSEAAADLTPVLEVAIEHLVVENLGGLRPDGLELDQQSGLGLNRAFRRLTIRCAVLRFDRLDLLVRHQQPLMLAPDLVSQTRRYGTPVAGAHLIEIRQEVRHQWLGIADPLCPCKSPLIRLVCPVRSVSSRSRSRVRRLRSSSSGVGTRTMLQTPGSPRRSARNARISSARSIRSVLARRARRFPPMLEASTSRMDVPLSVSPRCSKSPSRRAPAKDT